MKYFEIDFPDNISINDIIQIISERIQNFLFNLFNDIKDE